jgi:hypothetical protein
MFCRFVSSCDKDKRQGQEKVRSQEKGAVAGRVLCASSDLVSGLLVFALRNSVPSQPMTMDPLDYFCGVYCCKVVGGLQEQYSDRDLCESTARRKPDLQLVGFQFSVWLSLILRGKQFVILWL